MMNKVFFAALVSLLLGLGACQSQPEYCTVKGTIKGVRNGSRLELQDEYDHFKVIETVTVKKGTFEFHPRISGPTHVYLYAVKNGMQLKDFILEPGTIIADVDATDDDDWCVCATGTPSNDLLFKIRKLDEDGDGNAADSLRNEVLNAGQTGILALYLADGRCPSLQGLSALDRLSEDIAAMDFASQLREVLTCRAKTEPAPEGSDSPNYFIDMEFPDVDGKPVSLSSVVNNPANRCVLLDFWATWCGPCRESIPLLKELYAKYHDKGLEIYSVSEDQSEKNWKSFLPENGMTWINVRDDNPGRKRSKCWAEYALRGIPTLLLIDGETGAILLRDNQAVLETAISSLLQ